MKLNLGSGSTQMIGWTAVDRKHGKEVYPLGYEDNSVEEIRASHILEHFPRAETSKVLKEWVRVLEPGGRIRIAVPDFDKIVTKYREDPRFEPYLFGGQTDENDYHHTCFTEDKLKRLMEAAGVENIQRFEDTVDTASLDVSLNLEGTKNGQPQKKVDEGKAVEVKVAGAMTLPRYGAMSSRGLIDRAFGANNIPLHTSQGVFWGQCLQRMFTQLCNEGVDIIVAVDYDTCVTAEMLGRLLLTLVDNDHIDCLCALESRRNGDRPLMTAGHAREVVSDGKPMLATTAHFGLTALRTENLVTVEKPWFHGQPDKNGDWHVDDQKMDPDIWFWHQWRKAGHNLYVDPEVRIGHLEETVAYYDEKLQLQRCSVPEWRERHLR